MPIAATMFENVDFGGTPFNVNNGENIPVLPPPMGNGDGQASSLHIFGPQWITFWESPFYDQGDDQLWIAPPPAGFYRYIKNLHGLFRPHGNNHWGDRIRCVSFSGAPSGDNDNRSIWHPDGHWTHGNSLLFSKEGVLSFQNSKDKTSLLEVISFGEEKVKADKKSRR
jgi:hypothetical protein